GVARAAPDAPHPKTLRFWNFICPRIRTAGAASGIRGPAPTRAASPVADQGRPALTGPGTSAGRPPVARGWCRPRPRPPPAAPSARSSPLTTTPGTRRSASARPSAHGAVVDDEDEGGEDAGGTDGGDGGSIPPCPCRARVSAPARPGTLTSAMYRISSSTAGLSFSASMMKAAPGSSKHATSRSTVTHAGPRHTQSPLSVEHVDARVPPGAVTRDLQSRAGLALAGGGLDAQLRQARLTDLGLRGDQRELRQARELGLTRVGGLDAQLRQARLGIGRDDLVGAHGRGVRRRRRQGQGRLVGAGRRD